MAEQVYEKALTANDTGESGGHQAGIHVPKQQTELIRFLPPLDAGEKNPSTWLDATDDAGVLWRFRCIYYNNRLHDPGGTRDEYRITHMTKFLRAAGAGAGDILVISGEPGTGQIEVRVNRAADATQASPGPIRLRGWRRVH